MTRIDTSGAARRRTALIAGLGAVAAAALLLRFLSVAEPLGIDQSLWASAVRGMSRGQLLYRDVWEQRPPGIYWIYLTGFRVFGWQAGTVALLDVLAAIATTGLLFVITRALSTTLAGALAAALYATLTMPAWLYRNSGFLERSVCETFISVAVAAAFWCAVSYRARRSLLAAAGIGVFAGMAIVLKPNAGLYLLAALAWIGFYAQNPAEPRTLRNPVEAGGTRRNPREPRTLQNLVEPRGTLRNLMSPLACACAATAIVPLLALAWLWQQGTLGDARIAVVDFNRFYVSQGFVLSHYAVDFSKAIWLRMRSDALWLAGGVGALAVAAELARTRRLSPLGGAGVLWGAAATLVIVVNGARLFNTYFIQALPPLAMLAAWLLGDVSTRTRVHKFAAVVCGALMTFVLLQQHYAAKVFDSASSDLAVLRGRMDRTAFLERFGGYQNRRGYSARANEELADYVRDHTAREERIYLFGINGAGVYFLSDRLTAHRFLRVNFFVPSEFPDPSFTLAAVTRDLAASRPRYIVFERLNSTSDMGRQVDQLQSEPAVVELLANYRREAAIEDFTLFRRVD